MRNHIRIAKAAVTTSCVLAIALLTIGMGINSTSARSDQSSRPSSRVAYCGAVGDVAHKMDCSDCCVHKCGFNANHTYVCK